MFHFSINHTLSLMNLKSKTSDTACALRKSYARMIALCCIVYACSPVQAQDIREFSEVRIDVTGNFQYTPGILDFSHIDGDVEIKYDHKVYSDTVAERYGRNEVELFTEAGGTRYLKSIVSRLSGLSFSNGLIYYSANGTAANANAYCDTLTIVQADGDTRTYPITASYEVSDGGYVIPERGDTIKTTKYTSGYSFVIPENSGTNKTLAYTNTRWISDLYPFPIVKRDRYTGWNGDTETVTIYRNRPSENIRARKAVKPNQTDLYAGELQKLVITDLSGKVYRIYSAEQAAGVTDYGLPEGWYIFTENYTDKNISTKKYIGANP